MKSEVLIMSFTAGLILRCRLTVLATIKGYSASMDT